MVQVLHELTSLCSCTVELVLQLSCTYDHGLNNIWSETRENKSSAIAEKADRCVASWRADNAFAKYPFPHSKFADYQSPCRNIWVRLSLLSTIKTSPRISHLLENLKTANQKVMVYICNYCKHFSPLSIEEYLTYTSHRHRGITGAGQWLYARRFAPITNARLQCVGLGLVWHGSHLIQCHLG